MSLPYSTKLDLLRALFSGKGLQEPLALLSPLGLLEAHRFVWEKTVEFGIKMRGRKFPQEELQAELRTRADLRAAETCPAQLKQCRLQECAERHPACMREVAIDQILTMSAAVGDYLQIPVKP